MEEIRVKICQALDKVGVFVEEPIEEANLNQFFDDSIQFMTFIVELENVFEIEFPNEILVFDNFDRIDNICDIVSSLMLTVN